MVYMIPILLVIFLLLYKVERNREELSIEQVQGNANQLRGFFAILIVLSHSTMAFEQIPLLLEPFAKTSTICVGYFFVASGYGLAWSCKNKNNYLNMTFLKKKVGFLFLMSIIIYIYYVAFQSLQWLCFKNGNIDISIVNWWGETNWYLKMQVLLYCIFFITYRIIDNRKIASWILTLIIVLGCSVCCCFRLCERSYYISELSFAFGLIMYEYQDEMINLVKNRKKETLVLVGISVALSLGAFVVDDYSFLDFALHNLLCIVAYCFILAVLFCFKVGNAVLSLLDKMSLELYLCQFALFEFYKGLFEYHRLEIDIKYVLGVVISDIIIAYIFMTVRNILNVNLKRRK